MPLEVRVVHARRALPEVLVDPRTQIGAELTIEVELDLLQDLTTLIVQPDHAPVPFPTTPSAALSFPDGAVT